MSTNFWALDDGEVLSKENVKDQHETEGGGGNMPPMPSGTQVKAAIEESKWETTDRDGTFISLKWKIVKPACHAGRVVFQKLHVTPDPLALNNRTLSEEKLRDKKAKALRMFAVIDKNSGGKLLSTPSAPTDETLQANLNNKFMHLKLDVYEMDMKDGVKIPHPADYIRGNWVKGVMPASTFEDMPKEEQEKVVAKMKADQLALLNIPGQRAPSDAPRQAAPQGQRQGAPAPATDFDSFDDDIPF